MFSYRPAPHPCPIREETHISGNQQAAAQGEGQIQIEVSGEAPIKIYFDLIFGPTQHISFSPKGKDFSLGQDVLAFHSVSVYTDTTKHPLFSAPTAWFRPSIFTFDLISPFQSAITAITRKLFFWNANLARSLQSLLSSAASSSNSFLCTAF